jgi:hypothetical protein
MRLLVLALLASGPVANARTIEEAFPPTIRVVAGDWHSIVKRVSIKRSEDVTWLAIRVIAAPHHRGFVESRLDVDVPAGTHVIGVELETGGKTAWGMARAAPAALARSRDVTAPTLVSWNGSSDDEDHLAIDVAGLTDDPTIVTLAVELPTAITTVRVEPKAVLFETDAPPHAAATVAIAAHAQTSFPHVDEHVSLLAEADVELPSFWHGPMTTLMSWGSVDKSMIRRRMTMHMPQLRRCYMAVAQWHPEVSGHVDVVFDLESDGHVSRAFATGSLGNDQVFACLAAEVASWEFPPVQGGGMTRINYPIDFKLNR